MCTAATYLTKDFYMGRTLDYEFSYGEEIAVMPRNYPIHFHSDFELNLVLWDFGRRIVGDSIEPFEEVDLVLTGPNVPHKWEGNNVESNHVITIQFHEQLLTFPILQKRMFTSIKDM